MVEDRSLPTDRDKTQIFGPRASARKRDPDFSSRLMQSFERKREEEKKLLMAERQERVDQNRETATVIVDISKIIIESLNDEKKAEQLIEALITGDSEVFDGINVKDVVKVTPHSESSFDLVQGLLDKEDTAPLTIYSYLARDSHYDYPNRPTFININFFSIEQYRSILEKIQSDEIRKKIQKSILLVFLEEFSHFLQYFKLDKQIADGTSKLDANPFLSKAMVSISHSEDTNSAFDRLTEADITFYFKELEIDVADSYWLEYHRKNYGHEEEVLN